MKICDIKTDVNNYIQLKVSKNSITILNDDTLKTAGIIRNITNFFSIQPNKQFDILKRVKGYISRDTMKNLYITVNNELVYIVKINILIDYESENTKEKYNNMLCEAEKLPEEIKVIYARIRT